MEATEHIDRLKNQFDNVFDLLEKKLHTQKQSKLEYTAEDFKKILTILILKENLIDSCLISNSKTDNLHTIALHSLLNCVYFFEKCLILDRKFSIFSLSQMKDIDPEVNFYVINFWCILELLSTKYLNYEQPSQIDSIGREFLKICDHIKDNTLYHQNYSEKPFWIAANSHENCSNWFILHEIICRLNALIINQRHFSRLQFEIIMKSSQCILSIRLLYALYSSTNLIEKSKHFNHNFFISILNDYLDDRTSKLKRIRKICSNNYSLETFIKKRTKIDRMINDINKVIESKLGYKLILFGSFQTTLSSNNSDVDLAVQNNKNPKLILSKKQAVITLRKLCGVIKKEYNNWKIIESIKHARVPIIRCQYLGYVCQQIQFEVML